MSDKNTQNISQGQNMTDALKSWVMVALTLIFVGLYAAALIGWLKPLTDITMITRLEPIIFVIIGYYFGRLPAQQNEKTLKDEINRQTQKADAAQHVKEQTQQEREALEEKVKNVKAVLTTDNNIALSTGKVSERSISGTSIDKSENLQHSLNVAINVLNS